MYITIINVLLADNKELNGPVSYSTKYLVEGINNGDTHYQHRDNNGVLVWNPKHVFEETIDPQEKCLVCNKYLRQTYLDTAASLCWCGSV